VTDYIKIFTYARNKKKAGGLGKGWIKRLWIIGYSIDKKLNKNQ
jgi:hypothetical protein